MKWLLRSFRFSKRPSPIVMGILLGLIPAPAFFIMDQLLPVSSYYITLREFGYQWQHLIHSLQFNAPLTEASRFLFHQLFFVGVILGALISAWLFGLSPKLRMFLAWRELLRITCYGIAALLGGFLFYFGLMWIMLERFDYWQLATGLFQLSLSAWLICIIALIAGMFTVFVLDKVYKR